jgi:hypothetical protein
VVSGEEAEEGGEERVVIGDRILIIEHRLIFGLSRGACVRVPSSYSALSLVVHGPEEKLS